MTTRMLIDARHREETRVAVIKGNRIEEFDFESAEHKQLKGNIYLAKVTRVEPSLQAAFVDYGGNRHGFLAFSEIHPDYYQIPKEDREALIREEAEHAAAEAAMRVEDDLDSLEGEIEDVRPPEPLDDDDDHDDYDSEADAQADADALTDAHDDADGQADAGADSDEEGQAARGRDRKGRRRGGRDGGREGGRGNARSSERDEPIDFRRSLHRRYKIQDVIRRRQVLLVQVVKEERGGKGAALTTYLSLAGRYCVLMPNSSHGGGISRKISNGADRKRLKSIIEELGLPMTMGCIVRTAGLERTKPEIKRDFDYLARLWDEIRERTLGSAAPALIHSDSDLIKRAIRDIYNSGIDEVAVEGEDGYRAAKDFMKLLMPSHAKKVQQYADPVPLFQRYGVEDQLGAMYQPVVNLKSGGYLVINPTEALVSIDINSGRSTREHNIEQTAVSTNLEAAYEIARQLRLRDMAGLVVIDFIDMDMGGNVRKVEKAMRDALKNDRARIQVGRISGFGLMEMSRQRLRTGVLEASTRACPHCEGTGLVRTASSAGLSALRLLEEEAARGRGSRLVLRASQEAALYVLNNKRSELSEIESRYGVTIEVQSDGQMEGARMAVEASGPPPANLPKFVPIVEEPEDDDIPEALDDDADDEAIEERPRRGGSGGQTRDDGRDAGGDGNGDGDGERGSRRRRGRRRRGGRSDEAANGVSRVQEDDSETASDAAAEQADAAAATAGNGDGTEDGGEGGKRRRRGRRGGRGRRSDTESAPNASDAPAVSAADDDFILAEPARTADAPEPEADVAAEKPKRRRKAAAADPEPLAPATDEAALEDDAPVGRRRPGARTRSTPKAAAPASISEAPADVVAEKPKRASRARKAAAPVDADGGADTAEPEPAGGDAPAPAGNNADGAEPAMAADVTVDGASGERRRGWWQRTFGT